MRTVRKYFTRIFNNISPSNTILTDHHHWTIVRPLSPPLHHVHQLHQRVGGGGHLAHHVITFDFSFLIQSGTIINVPSYLDLTVSHLVSLGPAHQLEQLTRLAGSLHSGHQLGQRHNLLVNLEDP